MTSFKISAPGKVILFGEHAVVYGKKAVAASLDQRTVFKFTELSSCETYIHLEIKKLYISKIISLNQVQQLVLKSDFPKLRTEGHDKFHQSIKEFVEIIGFQNQRQKTSIECFFYALIQILQEEGLELKPFKVEIDSELSIGAGLGSSASFSVCLVAGFLHWSQLQKNTCVDQDFNSKDLSNISQYAFNCEKIMHGTPSGIDNSICTFGSVIEFQKGTEPTCIPLGSKNLKILLVDTKVDRSTKVLVNKLAGLKTRYPEILNKILDGIDEISKKAINVIKPLQALTESENDQYLGAYKDLSVLVNINQGLLSTCQVSHFSLDLICIIASRYGFSAKLTGAGGGGFAYVLIPPDASDVKIQDLSSELTQNGFSVIKTNLGGSGIKIHAEEITPNDN